MKSEFYNQRFAQGVRSEFSIMADMAGIQNTLQLAALNRRSKTSGTRLSAGSTMYVTALIVCMQKLL